ncbi:hypothetical protein [Nonomuraea rubra]|uniref:ABC-2 type transport system permease protein n=1 Tax=Nonomuraea rubra TaxID=46180 RepID=A0A7X0NUI0_9ACTN|nr:hypothetical protein [Nonomuraea rubra]MBB6549888.1 ABC-2 type transport system permease protein [Nonomuraea rubra]
MTRTLFALKVRLFRNGPHNERAFCLVAGLALAVLVIAAAALDGVDEGWIAVAITVWGGMWLFGPLAQPRHDPSVISREWLRGYPIRPWRLARALSWTELLGVGPLITLACLSSLVVLAAPGGPAAVAVALAAVPAQLYLLVWAGKTAAALAGRLLQSRAGMTLAAMQTAIMLALSFAGWVPVAAWLLPRLGEGDTTLVVPTLGHLPEPVIGVLAALPTGWGYGAVAAARDGAGAGAVVLPLAALLAVGAGLQAAWIVLTARALRRPPRRANPRRPAASRGGPMLPYATQQVSRTAVPAATPQVSRAAVPFASPQVSRAAVPFASPQVSRAAVPFASPQVSAVVARELATWLRDPARGVELRTAWLTPLLMAVIIAFTGWSWAVPLVGPAAAVFGAMAAINTYALDGTALWQLLTTPGALKADVRGRMAAWALLFGVPSIVLAAGLQIATGSPLGQAAIGGAVAAAATGCAMAPLLALLMPAVGTDARHRVYPGQQAGDPTGGQMTIFPVTLLAAALPGVIGGPWWVTALAAVVLAAAVLSVIPRLAVRTLRRRGTALLGAMAAGDAALLRPSPRADAKM